MRDSTNPDNVRPYSDTNSSPFDEIGVRNADQIMSYAYGAGTALPVQKWLHHMHIRRAGEPERETERQKNRDTERARARERERERDACGAALLVLKCAWR